MQRPLTNRHRAGSRWLLASTLFTMLGTAAACPMSGQEAISSEQAESCTMEAALAWVQSKTCTGTIPNSSAPPECLPVEWAGTPQVHLSQSGGWIDTTDGKRYFSEWASVACGVRTACGENLTPHAARAYTRRYRDMNNLGAPPQEIDQTCPVYNAVRPGSGEERHQETDVELGRLTLRRYYSSSGYAHYAKRGLDTHNSIATAYPFWSHSFAARVFVPGLDETAVAVAVRADLVYKRFGADGLEIGATEGGRDRLEKLLDGANAMQGWRYTSAADGNVEIYNSAGYLTSITARDGYAQNLTYAVAAGQPALATVSDSHGRTLVFSHDAKGRLTGVQTPASLSLVYVHDDSGNLTEAQFIASGTTLRRTYEYADSVFPRLLTGVTDENQRRHLTFRYDNRGRLVEEFLAGGVGRVRLRYDSELTTITTPGGSDVAYTHRQIGHVRKISSVTENCAQCSGGPAQYAFDAQGFLDVATDADGTSTDTDYNARGLLVQSVKSANRPETRRTQQVDWHADFDVPVERRTYDEADQLVAHTRYTYNARGQVLSSSEIDPASGVARITSTRYCEQSDVATGSCPRVGLLLSVDGPRTDVLDITKYEYRAADASTCAASPATCAYRKGDLWKTTNALDQVVEIVAYDGAGHVRSVRDANGVTSDFEYSARGWLTAKKIRGSDPGGESDDRITRIDYWPTGLVKQLTQPDGAFTTFEHDDAHRLVAVGDNAGNRIVYTLNDTGQRIGEDVKDAAGVLRRTLTRTYNALGQLERETDAYGHKTRYTYDESNNTDLTVNALERTTDGDFDALNRLSRLRQDIGGIAAETAFEYDAEDNLTRITDPKGLPTDYGYDAFGSLVRHANPDTGITTFNYDEAGNRTGKTDARGATANYAHDALDRLTAVTYPSDATLAVTYTYDSVSPECQAGETFATGRLSRMDDASGSTRYCYDRFGQLARRVQHSDGKTFVLHWRYLASGRLSHMGYPDGSVVDYAYDSQGRIVELGVTRDGLDRLQILREARYHPFGTVAHWIFANGRSMDRGVNLNYQPDTLVDSGPGGFDLRYQFDAVGNLEALYSPAAAALPRRVYRYDTLDRLSEMRDGANDTLLRAFAYDKTGNRTQRSGLQTSIVGDTAGPPGSGDGGVTLTQWVTTPYAYAGANHRVLSIGGEPRGYDDAGNLVSIGDPAAPGGVRQQYTYDAANRLRDAGGHAPEARYHYNGHGERVRKTDATVTHTIYDERGRWLGDYDANGYPRQQMVWLGDLPVALLTPENRGMKLYYLTADALGAPRAVIDPARQTGGTVVWRWDLDGDPFGADAPLTDPDGDSIPFVFDYRFAGQRYDATTGFNENYFRDYDAANGRYTQSDPIGLAGGLSTYAYVANQPLQWNDPLGLGKKTGIGSDGGNYSDGAGGNAAQRRQTTREFLRQGTGDMDYLDDASGGVTEELVRSVKDIGIDDEFICLRVICFRRQQADVCTRGDGLYEATFWTPITAAAVNRMPGCRCERKRHITTYSEPQLEGSDVLEALTEQLRMRNYLRRLNRR